MNQRTGKLQALDEVRPEVPSPRRGAPFVGREGRGRGEEGEEGEEEEDGERGGRRGEEGVGLGVGPHERQQPR